MARLGTSVGIHLVGCTMRPDAEVERGQLKVSVDGTVAVRITADIKSFTLLDGDGSALPPPHPGRGV